MGGAEGDVTRAADDNEAGDVDKAGRIRAFVVADIVGRGKW